MELKNLNDYVKFKKESLTKQIIYSDSKVLCFILNLLPGHTIPVHKQENSVLTAIVLKGKAVLTVNGKDYELSDDSQLIIELTDDFGIPTVKEDLSLYVSLSPNPENPIYAKPVD